MKKVHILTAAVALGIGGLVRADDGPVLPRGSLGSGASLGSSFGDIPIPRASTASPFTRGLGQSLSGWTHQGIHGPELAERIHWLQRLRADEIAQRAHALEQRPIPSPDRTRDIREDRRELRDDARQLARDREDFRRDLQDRDHDRDDRSRDRDERSMRDRDPRQDREDRPRDRDDFARKERDVSGSRATSGHEHNVAPKGDPGRHLGARNGTRDDQPATHGIKRDDAKMHVPDFKSDHRPNVPSLKNPKNPSPPHKGKGKG